MSPFDSVDQGSEQEYSFGLLQGHRAFVQSPSSRSLTGIHMRLRRGPGVAYVDTT